MSKTVHWQLPFAALDGTKYRIDIYAEGACASPVQLTGAASPFETSEDSSDDIFEPVRGSVGTIHIINDNLEDMSSIQPANATDRPVRLIRISDNAIMWMGFLSCEVYNQEYTSRPHTLDLSCNSILNAMGSIPLTVQPEHGVANLNWWLNACADELPYPIGQSIEFVKPKGITYKFADYSGDIVEYITQDVMAGVYISSPFVFSIEENSDGNGTIEQNVVGKTAKELISDMCEFFGWCAREVGNKIYIEQVASFNKSLVNVQMSALKYMGCNHQISTKNGARRVIISNSVEDAKLIIERETTPCYPELTGDFLIGGPFQLLQAKKETYTNTSFSQCRAQQTWSSGSMSTATIAADSWEDPFNRVALYGRSGYNDMLVSPSHSATIKAGACFAKYGKAYTDFEDPTDCIFAQFLNVGNASSIANYGSPIISIKNPIKSKFTSDGKLSGFHYKCAGRMKLTISADAMGVDGRSVLLYNYSGDMNSHFNKLHIYITFRIGSRYFAGSSSAPVPCQFDSDGNIEAYYQMPSISDINFSSFGGDIELNIYPILKQEDLDITDESHGSIVSELAIKDLKLEYLPPMTYLDRSDGTNEYGSNTECKSTDVFEKSLPLATYNSNKNSFMLIIDSKSRFITELGYEDEDGVTTQKRPEEYMLQNVNELYSAPRNVIDIEVMHPTQAPLPLMKLTGYDGKKYIPLSEERDWQTGVSTIKCFEVPN